MRSNPDFLLRLAQADAFAVAVEYVDERKHPDVFEKVLKFDSFVQHPTYHTLRPGQYTDDTQQSIAVAEVLLKRGLEASETDFINAFYECFKRDPRDGYSRGFQALIESSRSPQHLFARVIPTSDSNGSAMRSVPLGIVSDPHEVVRLAYVHSSLTHATSGGSAAAAAVALMSHYAHHGPDEFTRLNEYSTQYHSIFELFQVPWSGPVKKTASVGVGLNTAHAVHTLLTEETSLMGMMRRLIRWGGDTDSVAALAWGIASVRYHDDVPAFMEKELEVGNESYGVSFLRNLGRRLTERVL